MRSRWALAVLAWGVFFVACDSDGGSAPDAGGPADGGADVRVDAAAPEDTAAPEDVAVVPEDAGAPDVAPDVAADVPYEPPFDPTVCGAPTHRWRPPTEVGEAVLFTPPEVFGDVTADQLNALLLATPYKALAPVPYGVRSFEMRYVTQDRGQLVEATAVVSVPVGVPEGQPVPIALWLHGTTGFKDECAPTYDKIDGLAAAAMLAASKGYIGIAPDYLGMLGFGAASEPGFRHPYLVAEPTALCILDSIRAALRGIEADPTLAKGDPRRVVLIGGSQGGHAAFFTERYAPHYAPELTIVAVGAGVPPTDLRLLARHATQVWGPAARAFPAALSAMRHWYGHPDDLVGALTDTEPHHLARTIDDLIMEDCGFGHVPEDVDTLEELYDANFLAKGAAGAFEELEPWNCFLAENSVATSSVPKASDTPYLVILDELDELVVTAEERVDFANLCDLGYRMEYLECAGTAHGRGAAKALPFMLNWVQDRLDGKAWPEASICTLTPPVDCDEVCAQALGEPCL